jgi:hypothetical protein
MTLVALPDPDVDGSCAITPQPNLLADPSIPRHSSLDADWVSCNLRGKRVIVPGFDKGEILRLLPDACVITAYSYLLSGPIE